MFGEKFSLTIRLLRVFLGKNCSNCVFSIIIGLEKLRMGDLLIRSHKFRKSGLGNVFRNHVDSVQTNGNAECGLFTTPVYNPCESPFSLSRFYGFSLGLFRSACHFWFPDYLVSIRFYIDSYLFSSLMMLYLIGKIKSSSL